MQDCLGELFQHDLLVCFLLAFPEDLLKQRNAKLFGRHFSGGHFFEDFLVFLFSEQGVLANIVLLELLKDLAAFLLLCVHGCTFLTQK